MEKERDVSSLLEISREDESLQNDAAVSIWTDPFTCSPRLFQIPNSSNRRPPLPPLVERKVNKDACEESKTGSANKENFGTNKFELAKLSIEPQQMKRKKRGGGFNLRKSLAWDRAFFTEEGVLDPVELSMLSGDTLGVIQEGRESIANNLDGVSNSPLRTLEDSLFKDLPARAVNDDGRKVFGTSPKPGSAARDKVAPASAAKRKVLSVNDNNRSASKRSGCPRPAPSSSLMKPPSVNTTKVVPKDTKVMKALIARPVAQAFTRSSGSSGPSFSHTKPNLSARQGLSARKTGSSANTKVPEKNVKSGPGKSLKKSAAQHTRKNVVKDGSMPRMQALANVEHHPANQGNKSIKVTPDPVIGMATSRHPRSHDDGPSENAACLSQNVRSNGESSQNMQPKLAKPSGLRMPSPSLGFFSQSKLCGMESQFPTTQSCSLLQNSSKLRKQNSSKLRAPHLNNQRPSHSTAKSLASVIRPPSDEEGDFDLEPNNTLKMEVQVMADSANCEMVSKQQKLSDSLPDGICPTSLDQSDQSEILTTSCKDQIGLNKDNDDGRNTDVCLGRTLSLGAGSSAKVHIDSTDVNDVGIQPDSCSKSRDLDGIKSHITHSSTSHQSLSGEVSNSSGCYQCENLDGNESHPTNSNTSPQTFPGEISDSKTNDVITDQQDVPGQEDIPVENFSCVVEFQSADSDIVCEVGTTVILEDQSREIIEVVQSSEHNEPMKINCGEVTEVDQAYTEGSRFSEELDKHSDTKDSLEVQESSATRLSAHDLNGCRNVDFTDVDACPIREQYVEPYFGGTEQQPVHYNVTDDGDESILQHYSGSSLIDDPIEVSVQAVQNSSEVVLPEQDYMPEESKGKSEASEGEKTVENPCDSLMDKSIKVSDSHPVKPPPNAPPFSDEWLAALESAGEEILTRKTGAVQNSPPEKVLLEPSPWSPVKRKKHEIGPYDCTKCTSSNLPPSTSS